VTNEIKVIDDTDGVTREELANLKKIAHYYGAGKIALSVIIGLGAAAIAAVHLYDFIHAVLTK